jgi:hypothetical protein
MPVRFVLDQNFPFQATPLDWPDILELVDLAAVDATLTAGYEDWEVLAALHRRGDVQGFVTNDAKMLRLAPEMVTLSRTRLALVVTEGVGHDPLRATGLLMTYLPQIAGQVSGQHAHIYVLTANKVSRFYRPVPDVLERLATKRGLRLDELIAAELPRIRHSL